MDASSWAAKTYIERDGHVSSGIRVRASRERVEDIHGGDQVEDDEGDRPATPFAPVPGIAVEGEGRRGDIGHGKETGESSRRTGPKERPPRDERVDGESKEIGERDRISNAPSQLHLAMRKTPRLPQRIRISSRRLVSSHWMSPSVSILPAVVPQVRRFSSENALPLSIHHTCCL